MQSRSFVLRVLFICTFIAAGPAAEVPRPTRVALVIGNHRYEAEVGALRNPDNDARAMAKALRTLGFQVTEKHNVTRDELMSLLITFGEKLPGCEVGLFYFAGHGLSVAGANYLLPIRSRYDPSAAAADPIAQRLVAETKLFNVEQAVAVMTNAGAACNLVILDACRNTAVARAPALRAAASRGGFTEVNPPAGSLVAFATDAGRTANDGSGPNGVYTEELIRHLLTPGLSIEQVFKRTRAAVIKRTDGAQVPAEYSRLVGDDIVLAAARALAPASAAPAETSSAPAAERRSQAEIERLAAAGELEQSILELHFRGPDARSARVLTLLLDRVKEALREPHAAKARAAEILKSCDLLVEAVEECLPALHPQGADLRAKAHNRRGDALLLLDRPADAKAEFDTAAALTPEDGYIVYNRGRAYLAMGDREHARADFTAAAGGRFRKSGARKLAAEALARMQ